MQPPLHRAFLILANILVRKSGPQEINNNLKKQAQKKLGVAEEEFKRSLCTVEVYQTIINIVQ
jgi:hypothetical protein